MTKIITKSEEYEGKLIDELNDLIECILCPTDLMDSIDEYTRLKTIEELENISVNFVIEIGEDGEEDYQNEISLHDVLERIIELKQ